MYNKLISSGILCGLLASSMVFGMEDPLDIVLAPEQIIVLRDFDNTLSEINIKGSVSRLNDGKSFSESTKIEEYNLLYNNKKMQSKKITCVLTHKENDALPKIILELTRHQFDELQNSPISQQAKRYILDIDRIPKNAELDVNESYAQASILISSINPIYSSASSSYSSDSESNDEGELFKKEETSRCSLSSSSSSSAPSPIPSPQYDKNKKVEPQESTSDAEFNDMLEKAIADFDQPTTLKLPAPNLTEGAIRIVNAVLQKVTDEQNITEQTTAANQIELSKAMIQENQQNDQVAVNNGLSTVSTTQPSSSTDVVSDNKPIVAVEYDQTVADAFKDTDSTELDSSKTPLEDSSFYKDINLPDKPLEKKMKNTASTGGYTSKHYIVGGGLVISIVALIATLRYYPDKIAQLFASLKNFSSTQYSSFNHWMHA